jgi:hypothetical protein
MCGDKAPARQRPISDARAYSPFNAAAFGHASDEPLDGHRIHDGIQVVRASTAPHHREHDQREWAQRSDGAIGLSDLAGNVFDGNAQHGIRVAGNSGRIWPTRQCSCLRAQIRRAKANGMFGIRCELGGYIDGSLGTLTGKGGVKDVTP